jgi:hypothetical protein
VRVDYDESEQWLVVHRGGLRVAANVSDMGCRVPMPGVRDTVDTVDTGPVVFATGAVTVRAGVLQLPARSAAILRTEGGAAKLTPRRI